MSKRVILKDGKEFVEVLKKGIKLWCTIGFGRYYELSYNKRSELDDIILSRIEKRELWYYKIW